MAKRQQREEGTTSLDDRRPRKTPSFKSVVLQVMSLCKLQNLMEPVLEPLIRRVVKEEVDTALRKYIISMKRNCGKDIQHSESMSLQLQFLNAISLPVFTGTRIEGEGGTNLEVALIDSVSGQVVSSGLGSSAKVEILVLEGDFDAEEKQNWTLEEFKNNTVREREGKKPLLSGDVNLTLNDGMGSVGNIMFTDNSSWTRSRKFRLGARILDNLGEIRVREARSEPFIVRDHRGELYKKHHPPVLGDEVWRLEKIGKDGAFHRRLRKERINTVQDFLMLFFLDPTRLRNILGTGMSAKMWEITVDHAQTCVLDKKLYSYGNLEAKGVVFNVVGQVIGVFSNGQYVPFDKLSEPEKVEARELVMAAFGDREKVVTLDEEPSRDIHTSSSGLSIHQPPDFPSAVTHHEDLASHQIGPSTYLEQQTPSFPDYVQSVFDDCLQGMDPIVGLRPDQHMGYTESIDGGFFSNEHMQYFEADFTLPSDIHTTNIGAFMPGSIPPVDNGQKGSWNVLVSVIRWCCSIKRIVARKTRVRELPRYS
ncbi:Calmodulin-binding protein 60 A [Striga hermonthica]|uniref:Calmodulin-binding protein 60 A n=1 Tax=Striga hermonthica TaxID=68872 RepID=A0A9N7NAA8_STRHE|nr:Calmodulin-binding protein 60 A [Striga hermonthica]